ncbi:MAG: hypothetical protein IPO67_04410 [Deltaproteobacteria bacterium]|nr:hypothetical protein [Deltaproteobacteria bacterium]
MDARERAAPQPAHEQRTIPWCELGVYIKHPREHNEGAPIREQGAVGDLGLRDDEVTGRGERLDRTIDQRAVWALLLRELSSGVGIVHGAHAAQEPVLGEPAKARAPMKLLGEPREGLVLLIAKERVEDLGLLERDARVVHPREDQLERV